MFRRAKKILSRLEAVVSLEFFLLFGYDTIHLSSVVEHGDVIDDGDGTGDTTSGGGGR